MKILLLHLGGSGEPGKGYAQPLGLSYIASYLRFCGYDVIGLDLALTQKDNHINYLKPNKQALKTIYKHNPDIVAMTCYTMNRHNVFFWAKQIKNVLPKTKIVIGGPHASYCSVDILKNTPEIDYVVKFEGEITFALLCKRLEQNQPVDGISSITFRKDNEVVDDLISDRITNLDSLPFPDLKAFPPTNYHLNVRRFTNSPQKTMHLITSRGCPAQCKFCSSGSFWRRQVCFRSPENVLAEIKLLVDKFGVQEFIIYDDSFTLKRSRLLDICDRLKNYKLKWMCWSRADALDKENLHIMYNSGCRMISIGVESGNNQLLSTIGKGINKEQVQKVVEACKSAQILPRLSFMIGLPGETYDMAMETVKFIKSLKLPQSCNVIGWGTWIFPGTPLFSEFQLANPDFSWYNTDKRFLKQAEVDRYGNFICPKIILPSEQVKRLKRMIYDKP